jgi:hypothetical protein
MAAEEAPVSSKLTQEHPLIRSGEDYVPPPDNNEPTLIGRWTHCEVVYFRK